MEPKHRALVNILSSQLNSFLTVLVKKTIFWHFLANLAKKMCSWTIPDQMWKVPTVTFFDWSSGLGGESEKNRQTHPVTEIPGANISLDKPLRLLDHLDLLDTDSSRSGPRCNLVF